MILNEEYGFDDHSTAVLTWTDGNLSFPLLSFQLLTQTFSQGVAITTSSVTSTSDRLEDGAVGPATKIIGTKGTITIPSPSYRPTELTLHLKDSKTTFRFPIPVSDAY
jgi:hypothetical protein